ncbi:MULTISPECIES: DUF4365 domain-containing protein [unclassified Serratia (in: enterobacteria)]|uniref:DUF4365 domain-containing protein n=1 Tax=unclassified Serratia (in: enterobacteria) TaxID=2647522 RepID=UPI0027FD3321|nr:MULTISPECIES: DUF4365 domain-containing protein [unclassified Serratia (in: enterobacteria)]MDQ7098735.1 DUF4365 domain-containing protein [Serratia sp. MF2]MDQ7102420.1 DUF4365 domain-containing protein [Serratia sp. MF1(2023)]
MRTVQHIIDTRSIKRVLNILPDHWVIRELTERDYGIDLLIEIFEKNNKDKNDHDVFVSTGAIFHAQVKGTNSTLKVDKKNNISFSFDKGGGYSTQKDLAHLSCYSELMFRQTMRTHILYGSNAMLGMFST